jgi:hypothetical protein
MAGWRGLVEGLELEERKRWGSLPAGEALYGTAGFRDRSSACMLCYVNLYCVIE